MKTLIIILILLTNISVSATTQDTEQYTKYTLYLMYSEDETLQQIYANILDRTFSMNLGADRFYDEVNNQSRCALTAIQLYYLDEEFVESIDAGLFMLLFNSALLESESNEPINSTRARFKKHYDWLKVLRSYVLSSGIIRGNIRLREEFDKIK